MGLTRDYMTDLDPESGSPIPETPATCPDCGRPTFYDYADEAYHHAIDAATGCFLIPAEARDDDLDHPLVGVDGTVWKRTR